MVRLAPGGVDSGRRGLGSNDWKAGCDRSLPSARVGCRGWVAERLNAPVLKTGNGESRSWVRIPPHPPFRMASFTGSNAHSALRAIPPPRPLREWRLVNDLSQARGRLPGSPVFGGGLPGGLEQADAPRESTVLPVSTRWPRPVHGRPPQRLRFFPGFRGCPRCPRFPRARRRRRLRRRAGEGRQSEEAFLGATRGSSPAIHTCTFFTALPPDKPHSSPSDPHRVTRDLRQSEDRQDAGEVPLSRGGLPHNGATRSPGMRPQSKVRKRFRPTTIIDPSKKHAPSLLDRDFTAPAPNQKWVADITSCAPSRDGSIWP